MSWCRKTADGWRLTLYVQPGAKKNEIVGLHGDALKLRIASPPVDGKANAALIAFIASCLGIRRHQLVLVRGQGDRHKVMDVLDSNLDPRELIVGPIKERERP